MLRVKLLIFEWASMVLPRFVENILAKILFRVIALFFVTDEKPLLKYCYMTVADFGSVTNDYREDDLSNGQKQQTAL